MGGGVVAPQPWLGLVDVLSCSYTEVWSYHIHLPCSGAIQYPHLLLTLWILIMSLLLLAQALGPLFSWVVPMGCPPVTGPIPKLSTSWGNCGTAILPWRVLQGTEKISIFTHVCLPNRNHPLNSDTAFT